MDETVKAGRVVMLRYTLKDEAGAVLEQTGRGVTPYLHGHGNLVKGLEAALEGRAVGDRFEITVPPDLGYGERKSAGPQAVPRREFGKNKDLRPGTPIRVQAGDGRQVVLWVTKAVGGKVWVDSDHPYAGKTLHFDVEIVGVRGATPEELGHGHAHGVHGEPHGH